MEVLDAEGMRCADRVSIEELGQPGLLLMEAAGRRVAEEVADRLGESIDRPVLILAGKGNNGGDGFVAARHLLALGIPAEVILIGARRSDLRGDAAVMAGAWCGLGGTLHEVRGPAQWRGSEELLEHRPAIIDALFGTGLSRGLSGLPAQVVLALNDCAAPVIAIDLPSGLDASSPAIPGPAVRADLTVTFCRPKVAQLLPPAELLCGELVVVDIGIPTAAVARARSRLHWLTEAEARDLLPLRGVDAHKGECGHVLVVGGSAGKSGAAKLCGLGALRGGAGLVTIAAPRPVRGEIAAGGAEWMTASLPSTGEGQLGREAHRAALELDATVLAVGPGLGRSPSAATEIRRLLRRCDRPVVLDADGLNAFAGRYRSGLSARSAPLVITPHPGEAARLLGCDAAEVQADRLGAARGLARELDAVCLLKGHRTLVAAPDGTVTINSTGNPGLAGGGSGDLLTGLIAALIGQGLDLFSAAALGAWLHGAAADAALGAGETEMSLTATRVADFLAAAERRLESEEDAG